MTTSEEREVTTFELDVYWASGRPPDAAIEKHLATCVRCSAYLRTLAAFAAPARTDSLPAARPSAENPRLSGALLRWKARRTALAASVMAAVAASVAIVFLRTKVPATSDAYVGIKGSPAVQLLLHRGTTTSVWDGHSPVRPGDALALRVACAGSKHVAVASPGAAGWQRLSDAGCPTDGEPLPFTLLIDGQPGDERLAVVLSKDPMDDDRLRKAIAESQHASEAWVVQFVLPKETDR
jgi:hypothetical protein